MKVIGVVSMIPLDGFVKSKTFTLFFPKFDMKIVKNEIESAALSIEGFDCISVDASCFESRNYEGDGCYMGYFDIYV